MSNQRSEQPCPRSLPDVPCTCGATEPVAVCRDCKSPDPKDRWCSDWNDITRAAAIRIPHVYEPELGCKRCTNPFHSRPEQGSRVPSVNAPLTAKWDKQPTAQTVAGTGNPTLDELADLRRQLAEKDMQIAALQEVIRDFCVLHPDPSENDVVCLAHKLVELHPSTLLDSIREEAANKERERCAKIVEAVEDMALSKQYDMKIFDDMKDSVNRNIRMTTVLLPEIAAVIRSQEPNNG